MMTLIAAYDPLAGWLGLGILAYCIFWGFVALLGRLGVWEALVSQDRLEAIDALVTPEIVALGLAAQTIVLVLYLAIQTLVRAF